jgi:phage terminase small subunit
MNERQKLFVKHYLIEPNATKAAIAAGYSKKTAYSQGQRLLKHVEVQQKITKRLEAMSEKLNISAEYVLSTVHETVERCRQARPVLDKLGQPILIETPAGELAAAYVFSPRDVLKGCELLGRHLPGFFAQEKAPTNTIIILTEGEKREAEQSLEKIQALASRSQEPLIAEFVERSDGKESVHAGD